MSEIENAPVESGFSTAAVMIPQLIVQENGLVTGAMLSEILSVEATEVDHSVYEEYMAGMTTHVFHYVNGTLSSELIPVIKILNANDFWSRFTENDDENLEAFDDAMMSKPLRIRRLYTGFTGSQTIVETDELWTVMRAELTLIFGESRTNQLLNG